MSKKLEGHEPRGYNLQPVKRGAKHWGVLCLDCGKILVSYNRHDYKTCGCPNDTMIDGGTEYFRCGGKDLKRVQRIDITFGDIIRPLTEEKDETRGSTEDNDNTDG